MLGKVEIGGYTFETNPRVEEHGSLMLQKTERAIDGTTLVSYVPDGTKVKVKKEWSISGVDLSGNQIEQLVEELTAAPPINFKTVEGEVYQVVVSEPIHYTVSADLYTVREYSFRLQEV